VHPLRGAKSGGPRRAAAPPPILRALPPGIHPGRGPRACNDRLGL